MCNGYYTQSLSNIMTVRSINPTNSATDTDLMLGHRRHVFERVVNVLVTLEQLLLAEGHVALVAAEGLFS